MLFSINTPFLYMKFYFLLHLSILKNRNAEYFFKSIFTILIKFYIDHIILKLYYIHNYHHLFFKLNSKFHPIV